MAKTKERDVKPELVPIWPDAGRRLGYGSRSAAYDAVRKGVIFTVPLGKIRRVPVRWLDAKTSGEEAA